MVGTFPLPQRIKVGLGCLRDPCQTTDPHGHCYHPEGCENYPHGCAACRLACPGRPELFNLEYYVQQGLQSEWRAIWGNDGPDSLKAGAVAYRTYAAYFQEHPGRSGSPNYDIRSDECQQAFNVTPAPPDPRTSAAAQATTGVALSQDGTNAYFSEYAANTNAWDGCQEGYTGDNTSNWPCMPDPIATLSQGSGHGRGMSQYGSWWWARGQSYLRQHTPTTGWQCILDHYYNDNGDSTLHETGKRQSFLYGNAGIGYGPSPDGVIVYAPVNVYPSRPLAGGLSSRTRRLGPADDSCGTYYAYSDLYTMLLDGTNFVDITPNKCNQYPAWAPTQKQIVHNRYTSDPAPWAISIINFDGTDDTPFLYDWPWLGQDWSLQNVIVYNNNGLYSINPDGSNGFQVNSDQYSADPSWFPGNGLVSLIAYDTCVGAPGNCSQEIFVINANGGQPAQLTSAGNNWAPSWSPDGTKIVYLSDASGSSEVWVMNSD